MSVCVFHLQPWPLPRVLKTDRSRLASSSSVSKMCRESPSVSKQRVCLQHSARAAGKATFHYRCAKTISSPGWMSLQTRILKSVHKEALGLLFPAGVWGPGHQALARWVDRGHSRAVCPRGAPGRPSFLGADGWRGSASEDEAPTSH